MITTHNLSRYYGDFKAVNDISFTIQPGEIVGLLGHNGAGKTTIMKMISGYLEPSSGTIEIDSLAFNTQGTEIKKRLGYLPETLPVYPEMSVADYLDYTAILKGFSGDKAQNEIRRVVKATDIGNKLLAPIATLSRGYKQRVGVAQAILGKPKLLILDEPTNGLDPTQTLQMRHLIRDIARDATVILSTHIMQEVDAFCDRVLIMRSGELALDAQLEDLRQSNRLILGSDIEADSARQLLSAIDGVKHIENTDTDHRFQITLSADDKQDDIANSIVKALVNHGHAVYELGHEQRDLETVFREVNEQSAEREVRHAA
ncbi:MAG: ABC transporter ATP-binding protein [Gammaproteobacteria bacterium]